MSTHVEPAEPAAPTGDESAADQATASGVEAGGGTPASESSRRLWTPEEDLRLADAVEELGPCQWDRIAKAVRTRRDWQCRERWHNHLKPGLTKRVWTNEEDVLLVKMIREHGTAWTKIAPSFKGRPPASIKNRFHQLKRQRERATRPTASAPTTPMMPRFSSPAAAPLFPPAPGSGAAGLQGAAGTPSGAMSLQLPRFQPFSTPPLMPESTSHPSLEEMLAAARTGGARPGAASLDHHSLAAGVTFGLSSLHQTLMQQQQQRAHAAHPEGGPPPLLKASASAPACGAQLGRGPPPDTGSGGAAPQLPLGMPPMSADMLSAFVNAYAAGFHGVGGGGGCVPGVHRPATLGAMAGAAGTGGGGGGGGAGLGAGVAHLGGGAHASRQTHRDALKGAAGGAGGLAGMLNPAAAAAAGGGGAQEAGGGAGCAGGQAHQPPQHAAADQRARQNALAALGQSPGLGFERAARSLAAQLPSAHSPLHSPLLSAAHLPPLHAQVDLQQRVQQARAEDQARIASALAASTWAGGGEQGARGEYTPSLKRPAPSDPPTPPPQRHQQRSALQPQEGGGGGLSRLGANGGAHFPAQQQAGLSPGLDPAVLHSLLAAAQERNAATMAAAALELKEEQRQTRQAQSHLCQTPHPPGSAQVCGESNRAPHSVEHLFDTTESGRIFAGASGCGGGAEQEAGVDPEDQQPQFAWLLGNSFDHGLDHGGGGEGAHNDPLAPSVPWGDPSSMGGMHAPPLGDPGHHAGDADDDNILLHGLLAQLSDDYVDA